MEEWDKYFLNLAQLISTRASCDRLNVGCVIVKDRRILCTGYNGSLPGLPSCNEEGHLMVNGSCIRTVHAEMNALSQASKFGISVKDAVAYITHNPCLICTKLLISSGIKGVYFKNTYRENEHANLFADSSNFFLNKYGIQWAQKEN